MVRRLVLFFALYVALALIFSIRIPVVATGVAYEHGVARAYSNKTSGYAYTLIQGWIHPPTAKPPSRTGDGPWNDYAAPSDGGFRPARPLPEEGRFRPAEPVAPASGSVDFSDLGAIDASEPALTLDTGRYITRLGALFAVLSTLWFGVIPYYAEIRQCVWFLPLFVYLVVAIWRLLYVPCTWTDHFRYRDVDHASTIALWNVGTESIRYGLLFVEELVLLLVAVACYGLAFAVIKHLRPGK